ncbi:MAG: hypothetical protein EOM67_00970 [Spirochaetia bacterium]|nr:hypothetical protein [Spirochaetia bacterium]
MAKRMKFHTTKRTIIISLTSLFLVFFAILFFSITLNFFHIDEPLILSSILKIEEKFNITIHVDSIETHIFKQIALHNIDIIDDDDLNIAHLDSITLEASLFSLLPRYIFNRPIPITIEGADFSFNESHIKMVEQVTKDGNESLPFSLKITAKNTSVTYNSSTLTAHGVTSILKGEVKEGRLNELSTIIDHIEVKNPLYTISSKDIDFTLTIDEKGETNSSILIQEIIGHSDYYSSAAELHSTKIDYKGENIGEAGQVSTEFNQVSLKYGFQTQPITYTTDSLKVTFLHDRLTLTNALASSTHYELSFLEYVFKGELFNLLYQEGSRQIELSLPHNAILEISDNEAISLEETNVTLTLDEEIPTLRFEGESLTLLNSSAFSSLIDLSLLSRLRINQPYARVTNNRGSSLFIFETSGAIEGESSFLSPQTFSLNHFSDGIVDNSLQLLQGQATLENVKSSLLNQLFTLKASYDQGKENPLTLSLQDNEGLAISYRRNVVEAINEVSFKSNNTQLHPYKLLTELLVPSISPFIIPTTGLSGELNLTINDKLTIGKVNTSLALVDIGVDDNLLNVASTLLASTNEEEITVELATITTTGVRLSYSGSINRTSWFPKGVLEATDVTKGTSLVSANFVQSKGQQVGYTLKSALLPTFSLEGIAQYASSFSFIKTDGSLKWFDQTYPLTSSFNQKEGIILMDLPGLSLSVNFLTSPGHLNIKLQTTDFLIPLPQQNFFTEIPLLSGIVFADYSLSDNLFLIQSENFSIGNLSFLGVKNGSASATLSVDPTRLLLENFTFNDSLGTIDGEIDIESASLIDLFSKEVTIRASLQENNKEIVKLTVLPDHKDTTFSIASLTLTDMNLERVIPLFQDTYLSFNSAGVTNFSSQFDMEGRISLFQDGLNPLSGNMNLSIDEDGINFSDGWIEKGNYRAQGISLTLPYSGLLEGKVDLSHSMSYVWRNADTTANLKGSMEIGESDNFFTFINRAPKAIKEWDSFIITHSNVSFFGMVEMKEGSHKVSRKKHILEITPSGIGSINANYNLETHFLTIDATKDFLFPMKGKGFIDTKNISMDLSYLSLDLTYLNAIFAEPIINFEQGIFEGSVLIEGPFNNPKYFGTMISNSLDLTLFWTGDQKLSLLNPVITLSENVFSLPYTKAVVSKKNSQGSEGLFKIEAVFENWNISNYQLEADITKGELSLSILIPQKDLFIEADAQGSFGLLGTITEEYLYGDIYAPNAKIGFGIPNLPIWFVPKTRTSMDFSFTGGKNVTFVYPNEENPIVSATVADNQKLKISISSPSMVTIMEGNVALRSGEIFYVQENFYITEGSLVFPKGQPGNIESTEPILNLRARLRKFDTQGDRIDIFLILQNDTLTNINPRFESFPLRTNNEILQILGQNLFSANIAENPDGGFQSILSAASAATDVISRLGLIQGTGITFGFSSLIRESLGLDVFSIRSNLLQNIIIEAIPGMSSEVTTSPISRYLDNTTLYIGKYLLDQLYLQGLLTFRRDLTGTRSSFLAEDLAIDTELSVEWLNDLATFSFFTQPEELSIFNLFDTMGFSITKSFEF